MAPGRKAPSEDRRTELHDDSNFLEHLILSSLGAVLIISLLFLLLCTCFVLLSVTNGWIRKIIHIYSSFRRILGNIVDELLHTSPSSEGELIGRRLKITRFGRLMVKDSR